MDLWLVFLLAAILVPVARLFMAEGCVPSSPPAPQPRGTSPLRLSVLVNNAPPGPGIPEGDAHNVRGGIRLTPPSGPSISVAVTADGLTQHPIAVTDAMFAGQTGPYLWRADCNLEFDATRPVPPPAPPASHSWTWDARREGHVTFVLRLQTDEQPPDTGPNPVPVRVTRWVITGVGP